MIRWFRNIFKSKGVPSYCGSPKDCCIEDPFESCGCWSESDGITNQVDVLRNIAEPETELVHKTIEGCDTIK